MNKSKQQKHFGLIRNFRYRNIGVALTAACIVVLCLAISLMYIQDKKNALVYAKETTDFLKGSCDRYDNTQIGSTSTANEMVRQSAETLTICSDSAQIIDTNYLTEFADSQKLSGIVILGENMELVTQVNTDGKDGYRLWQDLIRQTSQNSIANFPTKSYISSQTIQDTDYSVAIVPRTDAKGAVLCYVNTQKLDTDRYTFSFTSLLENNTFHKNPTIIITNGKDILSSNASGLNSLITVQDQDSSQEDRQWNHDELLHLRTGYQSFYGTRTVYGNYHIFVFYPSRELFSNIPIAVAFSIAGIAILIMLFVLVSQHYTKENIQKEESQIRKIRAIGSLYSSTLLLHLDTKQFEIINLSEQMEQLIAGKTDAYEIYQIVSERLIAPESREAFAGFLSPDNLEESIKHNLSTGQTFQDIHGIWFSSFLIPESYSTDGTLLTVLVVTRNINDYKAKEEAFQNELRKTARDADMANAVKTTFLRRMSHDIRTPINGIQGMTEIARKNIDNPDTVKECLDKITSSSAYLLDLVNDVLRMSKLESGNVVLEEKPFYFQKVMMETASFIEIQAQQKGVKFSTGCRHDSGKLLLGSPLHVRQILQNIMSNAVKYTPAGGSVTVTSQEMMLREKSATYEIFCTDTGIGMSKEFQEHAFEPFVQEDDTSARSTFTGVGLGLSIVKDLVDRMHGKIRFNSEQGKGTTFVITLTFQLDPSCYEVKEPETTSGTNSSADNAPVFSKEEADEALANSLAGLRILVAEDNELNMDIAKYLLGERGASVKEAHNGQEALDLFNLSKPGTYDLILMDIMMPVMNGLEASKAIRVLPRPDAKTIPIFAMTANAFVEDIQQSSAAGMNEHLTKPLDIDELVEKIQKYCRKTNS